MPSAPLCLRGSFAPCVPSPSLSSERPLCSRCSWSHQCDDSAFYLLRSLQTRVPPETGGRLTRGSPQHRLRCEASRGSRRVYTAYRSRAGVALGLEGRVTRLCKSHTGFGRGAWPPWPGRQGGRRGARAPPQCLAGKCTPEPEGPAVWPMVVPQSASQITQRGAEGMRQEGVWDREHSQGSPPGWTMDIT